MNWEHWAAVKCFHYRHSVRRKQGKKCSFGCCRGQLELRLFVKRTIKCVYTCISAAGQKVKTNIQKSSLCFLAHFLKQTELTSVFVGEGQSARMCERRSSGALPLSSSPHLKQIHHIRFVMSSHPTGEKRLKRLFLLYFTGPRSHRLHFFPQLDAKYGCSAGVLAVAA